MNRTTTNTVKAQLALREAQKRSALIAAMRKAALNAINRKAERAWSLVNQNESLFTRRNGLLLTKFYELEDQANKLVSLTDEQFIAWYERKMAAVKARRAEMERVSHVAQLKAACAVR